MSRTIEAEYEACNGEVELEIADDMLIYRVGTGGAAAEMRSDIRTNGRAVAECSEGHEVAALLVSADRSDLPDALEKQKSRWRRRYQAGPDLRLKRPRGGGLSPKFGAI